MNTSPSFRLVPVAAILLLSGVTAGCDDSTVNSSPSTTTPSSVTTTTLAPTEDQGIEDINAACRAFLAGDAKSDPNATGPEEIRAFADARIALIEAAKASLATARFPDSMVHLRREIGQMLDGALVLYQNAATAESDQLGPLRAQAEDLIRQVAVTFLQEGAQDCVPTVRERAPAPLAADAGELLPRAPVATITVGPPGVDDNRVVADTHAVWVGLKNLHQMVRIDPATNTVVANIDLGDAPSGGPAIVDGYLWIDTPQEIIRIDPATNTIDRRFPRGDLGYGDGFPVHFTRDELYTCVQGVLHVTSPTDGSPIRAVTLPTGCIGAATDGRRFWVASTGPSSLMRIDPVSGDVLVSVPEAGLSGMALVGDSVWAYRGSTIMQFDADTGKLLGTATRSDIDVLQYTPGGGAYWITSSSNQRAIRVDAATMKVTELEAGAGANAIAYFDGTVWIANSDAGTVMRYDVSDLHHDGGG